MDVALGVLLGIVLAASAMAVGRLASPRRVLAPGEEGVRAALHAAATTLPYLRRGLTRESAGKAIGHLHALTQATAVAIGDREAVLAFAGAGAEHVPVGEPPPDWLRVGDRVHVEPRLPGLPFATAVVAPLVVQGERTGWLAAFHGSDRHLRPEDTRLVAEMASLVAAHVELSAVAAQEERLAQAELRALRAQISPHFIYNALAAVANSIHTRPEEARELLIEFAEFTRYAFRGNRDVRDARRRAALRREVPAARARALRRTARGARQRRAPRCCRRRPRALAAAARRERRAPRGRVDQRPVPRRDPRRRSGRRRRADRVGRRRGDDRRAGARRAGGPRHAGSGWRTSTRGLQSTFGAGYGLEVETAPGAGTSVRMLVPKFRAGVRAA